MNTNIPCAMICYTELRCFSHYYYCSFLPSMMPHIIIMPDATLAERMLTPATIIHYMSETLLSILFTFAIICRLILLLRFIHYTPVSHHYYFRPHATIHMLLLFSFFRFIIITNGIIIYSFFQSQWRSRRYSRAICRRYHDIDTRTRVAHATAPRPNETRHERDATFTQPRRRHAEQIIIPLSTRHHDTAHRRHHAVAHANTLNYYFIIIITFTDLPRYYYYDPYAIIIVNHYATAAILIINAHFSLFCLILSPFQYHYHFNTPHATVTQLLSHYYWHFSFSYWYALFHYYYYGREPRHHAARHWHTIDTPAATPSPRYYCHHLWRHNIFDMPRRRWLTCRSRLILLLNSAAGAMLPRHATPDVSFSPDYTATPDVTLWYAHYRSPSFFSFISYTWEERQLRESIC